MGNRPKYTNPDDMQALIHLYFEDCKKNRVGKANPESVTEDYHPTVSGLALVLDLSRTTLINYEGKEEFKDTVSEAKARIESYNEQALYQNVSGVIFNLKNNFGWKDKSEVENSGPGGGPIEKKLTVEFVNADNRNKNSAS